MAQMGREAAKGRVRGPVRQTCVVDVIVTSVGDQTTQPDGRPLEGASCTEHERHMGGAVNRRHRGSNLAEANLGM